jgi:hypothetical protein
MSSQPGAESSHPPTVAGPVQRRGNEPGADATGGVIPYKNPHALIGYYVSICSLLPILGAIAGPAAVVLGIMGLVRRKRTPIIRGSVHAWIAIILGTIGFLISGGCLSALVFGNLS